MTDRKEVVTKCDQLKPCPFCGGEAEIKEDGYTIECQECYITRSGLDVIPNWNTRCDTTIDKVLEIVKEARQEVDKLGEDDLYGIGVLRIIIDKFEQKIEELREE